MAKVTIQYWAAAKEAAGLAAESVEAETLAEALDVILARRADDGRLRSVLAVSSFLVDGAPAGRRAPADLVLPDAARIEVLPPFAGGLGVKRLTGVGIPSVLRDTEGITPYSVHTSTFRSHFPAGEHERARTTRPSKR